MPFLVKVAARNSPLSRAQVEEVYQELKKINPEIVFEPVFVETRGDRDKTTSLRDMSQNDFFTREVDDLVLNGICDLSIHSAKDLPDPLPSGLKVICYTKGVDPSDVIVLRDTLPSGARVATSSIRREENVLAFRPDLVCVDIRGTIAERLAILDSGQVDGVVMAKAALIRLRLNRITIDLPGLVAPMQGRLALCARENDQTSGIIRQLQLLLQYPSDRMD